MSQNSSEISKSETTELQDDNWTGCDICDAPIPYDEITMVVAFGIETIACAKCRGLDDE